MFEKYIEQVLKVFRYVDSALITDADGNIQYYYTRKEYINGLNEEEVIGRHILDVFSNIDNNSSTIMQVLATGRPVLNMPQQLVTYEGVVLNAMTSTLPIMESNRLIGTIDVSSYNSETFAVSDEYIKKEKELYTLDDMVTLSESMVDLKEKIQKISNTDSSVMIYGETGTGKELVAQSIHTSGKRKGKPFIAQNCSAIPASLLESILFGTTKGSFTGAEDRKGLFELADGGTLFLDEINSMELSVQGKLLKAIEEKQFTRVGGSKPIHVDVKIISATNEKLEDSVARGVIRQDLLYRLSVVRLNIPPLRERMIDIGPLVQHFISLFNYKMDRQVTRLEDGVYDLFNGYNWPGNVRELRSAIESGFNISSGRVIRMKDLPEYLVNSLQHSNADKYEVDYTRSLKDMVEDYERHIIEKVLAESSSKVEAATKLKTTKQVFNYKLKKYNIE